MHYQQYYFMFETHRVTLPNDVISYIIFLLKSKNHTVFHGKEVCVIKYFGAFYSMQ